MGVAVATIFSSHRMLQGYSLFSLQNIDKGSEVAAGSPMFFHSEWEQKRKETLIIQIELLLGSLSRLAVLLSVNAQNN